MTINPPQTLEQVQAEVGDLPATDLPMALFPVRLETRFVELVDAHALCVRVFPDELHVETHETGMTEDEERWGKHLWRQAWRAGGDEAADRALRDSLAARFGSGRAAWIAQKLRPKNPDDRPDEPVAESDPLPKEPAFPDVPGQEEGWTRPPLAHAMPDRWVVLGYREGRRVLAALGRKIPDRLQAGPDPQAPPPDDPKDDALVVDDGMRWMVDFERAVQDGMGLRIPIATSEAEAGYQRLIVLGVKSAGDGEVVAAELEELLEAQRYTDSLAFVPQGTPSNNTAEANSGYGGSEPEQWSALLSGDGAGRSTERSNRIVTAEAFGLQPSVFERIPHANEAEQADARAFNTALWPATWGYFLRFILHGALTDDRLERARRHFIDFVRARGPLPALRVGRQPYGILPITVLDRYLPADDDAFGERGLEALRSLRARWGAMVSRSPHVRAVGRQAEMEQSLADILGRGAVTDHILARAALDGGLYGLRPVDGLEAEPGESLQERKGKAVAWLRELGVGVEVPGASMLFTEPVLRLSGGLAATGETPTEGPLTPDYVTELREASVSELLEDSSGADDRPAVLRRLLRHAVLLAYAEAAYRIQVAEGVIEPGALDEPALVDVLSSSGGGGSDGNGEAERTLTPLRLLDAFVPVASNAPLRDVIHELGASDHPQAAVLDEMRKSLDHLASVPAAALDVLLREVLDLASHRLDAWITSLATARLHRLRQDRPTGLLLGGYGWVEGLRMAGTRSEVTSGVPGEELDEEANGPLFEVENNGGYVAAPSLTHASAAAVLRSGYLAYANGSSLAPFAIDLSSDRVRLAEWLLDGVRHGQPLSALLGYRFERSLRDNGLAHYIRAFRLVAPFGELYEAMARKAALEDELSALEARHQEQLAVLSRAIDTLNSRIESSEARRSSLRSRIRRISAQIVSLNFDIRGLENQLEGKRDELEDAKKPQVIQTILRQMSEIRGQIDTKEGQVEDLKKDRAPLQRQLNAVTSEINSLKNQRNARQNELAALIANFRDAMDQLEAEIARVQDLIEELEAAQREKYTATSSLQAMETIEVQHVVDGMALVRKRQAGAVPFGQRGLPDAGTADAEALGGLLDALASTADAVGDLVTAEGVFQFMQGNPLRAGATLDAVARGETPPPEPQFVRTPRRMSAHTHRVAVLLGGEAETPAAWTTDAFQRRAPAEPALNAWIARLLPDPKRVRIEATFRDPETGDSLASATSRLGSFQLSPLDAVYMAGAPDRASALEALINFRLLPNPPPGAPSDARVTFDYERGGDWPADHVSLGEFLEVARAALQLITEARPLDAQDLVPPEVDAGPNVDHAEVKERADAAAGHFRNARSKLRTELEEHEASELELDPLRTAIFRLFWLGIPEAVPQSAAGNEPGARRILLAQARAVLAEADRRVNKLDEAESGRGEASPVAQVDVDVERLRIIFGSDFRVLPRFAPAEPETLKAAFGDSLALQGGDAMTAVDWYQQAAHVRDGVARLNASLTYAEALSAEAGMDFTVAQLPRRENDRWIALPFESEDEVSIPRLSLIVQLPDGFGPDGSKAGLLIDEWVEALPSSHETAGVAFHFDAPAAQAPQSILLAVPPDERPRWDLETLEAVVQETLDLARMRAVDEAAIAEDPEYGQFLPALYLAFNPASDTISTDLSRAAER